MNPSFVQVPTITVGWRKTESVTWGRREARGVLESCTSEAQFTVARMEPKLVVRHGAKTMTTVGSVVMLAAAVWFTQLDHADGYATTLLGPLILLGAAVSAAFLPHNGLLLAVLLPQAETGAGSELLQCLQQLGIALAIPVLTTIYGASMHDGHTVAQAVASAFPVAVALIAAAVVTAIFGLRAPVSSPDAAGATQDRGQGAVRT